MNGILFRPHYNVSITAATIIINAASPGTTAATLTDPFNDPRLVLPIFALSFPECPFDVASTAGATEAVFAVFVYAVVAKVLGWSWGVLTAGSARKTRANEGALTGTWQLLAPWSHGIMVTLRSPLRRPSASNLFPSVWLWEGVSTSTRSVVKGGRTYLASPSKVCPGRHGGRGEVSGFGQINDWLEESIRPT